MACYKTQNRNEKRNETKLAHSSVEGLYHYNAATLTQKTRSK